MNLKDLTGKTVRETIDEALLRENASSGATSAASIAVSPGGGGGQGAIGVGFDPNGHDRGIYPAPKKRQTKKSGVIKR